MHCMPVHQSRTVKLEVKATRMVRKNNWKVLHEAMCWQQRSTKGSASEHIYTHTHLQAGDLLDGHPQEA
eukprot:985322-Pelagomonas_calceolata.AAC.4